MGFIDSNAQTLIVGAQRQRQATSRKQGRSCCGRVLVVILAGASITGELNLMSVTGEPKSEKNHALLLLASFAVSFLVYAYTLAPSVSTIFDDTLEFQVVIPQLGIAHPTGYPLFTLIGKLFTLLPVGDPAYRTNLLSAASGALAAAFVSLIVARVSGRSLAGFAAGLALALSPVFWSQSTLTEVYTMNALFITVITYCAVLWAENERDTTLSLSRRRKWLWFAALAFGFSLTHHRTIIFTGLALFVFIIVVNYRVLLDKKSVLGMLACVLAPLSLYLYIPVRGLSLTSLDGSYKNTLAGFLRYVSGLSYDVFLTDNPLHVSRGLLDYVQLFDRQFQLFGLVLAALGFLYLLRRSRRVWVLTTVAFLAYTAFTLSYHVADVQVFFVPSFVFISIWLGLGLGMVMDAIARLVRVFSPTPVGAVQVPITPGSEPREVWRPSSELVGNALALVAPVVFLIALRPVVQANYPTMDHSRDWSVYDYGHDVLSQPLEKQATIIGLLGETTLLHYFQLTEGLRSDIVTVAADGEQDRRAAVTAAVQQGQAVYLTRPLPGISELFNLSAVGPLIRVQKRPGVIDVTPDFASNLYLTDSIHLLGYNQAYLDQHSRTTLRLTFFWEVSSSIPASYKFSVRVFNPDGNLVGQTDAMPVHDAYPTVVWSPGEVVRDVYDIPIVPGTPAGECKVRLVLYQPDGGEEVARAELGSVWVKEATDEPSITDLSVDHVVRTEMLSGVQLLGYGLQDPDMVFKQGEMVPLNLLWRFADGSNKDGAVRIWLEGADASQVLSIPQLLSPDGGKQLGSGLLRQWVKFPVTARVPDGTYPLYLAAYSNEAAAQTGKGPGLLLANIVVKGRERVFDVPAEMETQVGAILDRKVTLLGFDMDTRNPRPGDTLTVTLFWSTKAEMDTSYTVFVHLVGAGGAIRAQQDSIPHNGEWPTTGWVRGEVIADKYRLTIAPDTPPGTYHLIAGMYKAETGQRLTATAGNNNPLGDSVPLTEIAIK
jgi:hypothetical protein